jgi:chromosome segregation ATPase
MSSSNNDNNLREQLADTKAELLKAQLRIEFRDLVTSSIEELTESVDELAARIATLEKKTTSLEKRTSKKNNPLASLLHSILFGP